ncbi:hypothetical protein BVRB_3g052460 [Beta vulgaris subsp. vulgaris]|nr:hypothetical protein BVRB_3g052460 [Beta vulgaris subsp. vulgaris]
MGVVTVSSSASRASLGLSRTSTAHQSTVNGPLILGFKVDKNKRTALVAVSEPRRLQADPKKENKKRLQSVTKPLKGIRVASSVAEASPSAVELDLNEAAAKLESIFKLSPATDALDAENIDLVVKERQGRRRKNVEVEEKKEKGTHSSVVKNRNRKVKRLSLSKRIELKHSKVCKEEKKAVSLLLKKKVKMKIPPVLPSSEHTWLFKLMEPTKALNQVKENLRTEFGRDPTDKELGVALNLTAVQVRRHMEVGHAARNKLIKHNLRLVLFVMNKYFQDFTNGPNFQDLCQAGVKGLITGIDRFEPRKKFQLSTYALFWIRHAIIRSMTVSSFTRVPFGLESVRVEIQRAKLELMFELKRMPREEEIMERIGISPERYKEVMRASNSVSSLHARHQVTQEEFIKGITDVDGVGSNKQRQPALLRLAIDDVLDSLKPKESLVIRQRYGLDGKGDRTLGEIAGNLNISREMVRKHEMKALMKLKHPTRVDYLQRHIS